MTSGMTSPTCSGSRMRSPGWPWLPIAGRPRFAGGVLSVDSALVTSSTRVAEPTDRLAQVNDLGRRGDPLDDLDAVLAALLAGVGLAMGDDLTVLGLEDEVVLSWAPQDLETR